MTFDIASYRLRNQRLSQTGLKNPVEVVSWFGAVQAQDFAGAKWAIGLRTSGLTEADVERAFSDGSILRTHVLRPTWHFVTPRDIRWLLKLSAPRVRALLAYNDRQLELNKPVITKSNAVLAKTLQGGKQLTRDELGATLQRNKVPTNGLRLTQLMIHAELDAVICSGPRRGKQFTYALLEERVPQAQMLEHQEAVVMLTKKYFTGHGPATLKDFIWWSGLSAADARLGLEAIKSEFEHEVLDGETYWFVASENQTKKPGARAYFLPNYDEYTVGYTNRSAVFDISHTSKLDARGSVLAQHVILTAGRIVATWKRTLQKNAVAIETNPFLVLKKTETKAIIQAAERYAAFLGLPFSLTFGEQQ